MSGAGRGKAGLGKGRGRRAGPRRGLGGWGEGAGAAGSALGRGRGSPRGWAQRCARLPGTVVPVGLRGCAPVPAVLTNLPLAAPELPRPLSHHPRRAPAPPAPAAPAAISLSASPAEPLLSFLLQAMAVGITHVLTVLSIVQYALRVGNQPDAATQDLLRQHEEQQSQEMAWLQEQVEQMEQRSQEPRGLAPAGMLLAACQHWWFWACAETLLVVFGLYQLSRQGSADSHSSSQQGSSSSEEEQREEDACEEKAGPYGALGPKKPRDKGRASAVFAKPFSRRAF